MSDTARRFNLQDQVKETDGYRVFCRDQDVRGRVQAIKNDIVTVRNIHGWTTEVHHSWLELASYQPPELKPQPTHIWHKPYVQNFCQHCGEKL